MLPSSWTLLQRTTQHNTTQHAPWLNTSDGETPLKAWPKCFTEWLAYWLRYVRSLPRSAGVRAVTRVGRVLLHTAMAGQFATRLPSPILSVLTPMALCELSLSFLFKRYSTLQIHTISTKVRDKISLYCSFPHFVFFQSPFCPPVFASCPDLVSSFYGILRCLTTLFQLHGLALSRQFYESFSYSCTLSLFLSHFLFPHTSVCLCFYSYISSSSFISKCMYIIFDIWSLKLVQIIFKHSVPT